MAQTISVNFGGTRKITISPMSAVFYDEEFNSDLLEDFMKMTQSMARSGTPNLSIMMKIIWSCEKAYNRATIANFQAWVNMLGEVNLADADMYMELVGAIQNEFFRGAQLETSPTTSKEN